MRILFMLSLACTALLTHAAPNTAAIQQLIHKYFPDAHVGVLVERADTGQVLVNINGKQHFTPASTTKVFTAYAALKTLGPDFTFKTGIYRDNKSIYIKFSGDPTLKSSDLNAFIKAIKAAGITRIDGPIVLDTTAVPAPIYGRGWGQDDLIWYYGAPVSAAIIDENWVGLQLLTTTEVNKAIQGKIPSNPPLPVTSYLRTASYAESDNLCQFNASMDANNHLTLYGCWPVTKGPVTLKVALANPAKRVAQILESQLKAQQITFVGGIHEGKTPAGAQLITEHVSDPLATLLEPVLERSHNLYSDALIKQVGLKQYQRATFQAGAYAVERLVYDTLKLPANSINLYDGSGLSNYNMVTPESLAVVLKSAYADTLIRDTFMKTLPRGGQSGTLAGRMATKDLVGKFVGKTGAMGHITNIAGYLFKSPEASPWIVVVMVNQTTLKKDTMRAFEIALMRQLLSP